MKSFYFTTLVLLMPLLGLTQKLKWAEQFKVTINEKADSVFRLKYINPATDTLMKVEQVVYSQNGDTLSFQKVKKLNWSIAKTVHKDSLIRSNDFLPQIIRRSNYILADVKPDEGRLLVFPWPYDTVPSRRWFLGKKADTTGVAKANAMFKTMQFSIPVEERINLGLKASGWHAGLLTIPIKVYLGAPDSVSAVQSAAAAGLYFGKRWGRKRFVKLPHEKEFSTYEKSTSFNLFVGVNKLDLDDKNTTDDGKSFKGSVTSLNYGATFAWHYKIFTAFIAFGWDRPFSDKAQFWSLKNKPWIGLGAGFEVF